MDMMDTGCGMWYGMRPTMFNSPPQPPPAHPYWYYPFAPNMMASEYLDADCMNSAMLLPSSHGAVGGGYLGNSTRSSETSSPTVVRSLASGSPPMLPPCRVCGERASGFHYGVNTCEACKGFFRRSMNKMEKYKCIGNGNCEIVSSRRGTCSACRFNRCVSVGMSKDAIKTGRYTHEKRAKDIAEVKRLEQMQVECLTMPPHRQVVVDLPAPVTSSSSVASTPSNVEYDLIIDRITRAHLQHARNIVDMITQRENEYLEQKALKESLFGRLKPLPIDEYMKIYETTGMDVDGRRDMIQSILPYLEARIKDFITFAKEVPLFDELPIDDQITIVKSSRFSVWLILRHENFNQQQRLYTADYGKVICEEEMTKLHDAAYINEVFAVNKLIRSLKLDYRETCVLAALVMMSPDGLTLLERHRVEQSQSVLVRCLLYLFARLRPHDPLAFAHTINVLMELRGVQHLHEMEEEKLATRWFDKIQFPPLVYEMWSS